MFISATNFPSKLIPQIHQNPQQQQKHDLWKWRSRAWGVAKTVFCIPMLHGKHFFFDRHAAWECDLWLLQHLPSENAIFFTFAARPQREARKSWKSHLGVMLRTCRRERCKKQIASKIDPSYGVYDQNALFDLCKNSISLLRIVHILQGIYIISPLALACVRMKINKKITQFVYYNQ